MMTTSPFERFDLLARNVLAVPGDAVRAKMKEDDLQIVAAIVAELRKAGFTIRVVHGELIARVRDDRKRTSHERRLVQRLENYYEEYPEPVRKIIGALRVPAAS
ncbi:MAG: hypothetical protein ACHQ4J_09075 [Candidatus Binatia bacterium]